MDKKVLFLLIILIWLVYCAITFKKNYLSDDERETFYNAMETVDKVLNEEKIPYFVICGTLLGIARNNDIILWDDDIDIAIFQKDIERYNNIDWSGYGFKQANAGEGGCGKIYLKNRRYIDVFPFAKLENKWRYLEKRAQRYWPNEYFSDKELFPLKRYDFGKIKVNGPNELIPYCERAYGNWKRNRPKWSRGFFNPFSHYKTITYKK